MYPVSWAREIGENKRRVIRAMHGTSDARLKLPSKTDGIRCAFTFVPPREIEFFKM
jgi:hypothetical protein